jgi:hypothetical protein
VNDKMPIPNSPLERRAELFKTVGVAVLVLGFVAATIIFLNGENRSAILSQDRKNSDLESSWKDSTLSPEDSKGSSRRIEMNYGKVAVLIVNWLHWWEQLKPHQWLAAMIATSATLIATACFFIAKALVARRI